MKLRKAQFSENAIAHDDIEAMLRAALAARAGEYSYVSIEDVYDTYFVYQDYSNGAGALYKCDYTISDSDTGVTVTLGTPEQVAERSTYVPLQLATFSLEDMTPYAEGDFVVYPNAVVFKAGDYKYKDLQLSVTPQELKEMEARWTGPVDGDLEHILDRTPPEQLGTLKALKGTMGHMDRIWVDPDGVTMRGKISVPRKINDNLTGIGVSAVIPLGADKRITGYTITERPRVEGAALMGHALFSHPVFTPAPPVSQAQPNKEKKMGTRFDKIMAALKLAGVEDEDEKVEAPTPTPNPAPAPTPPTSPTPNPSAVATLSLPSAQESEAHKALLARNAELEDRLRVQDAEAAYNRLFSDKLVVPAQREDMVALFSEVLGADAAAPRKFTFSQTDDKGVKSERVVESRMALLDRVLRSFKDVPSFDPMREYDTSTALFAIAGESTQLPTTSEGQELANLRKATLTQALATRGIAVESAGK